MTKRSESERRQITTEEANRDLERLLEPIETEPDDHTEKPATESED